MKGALKKKIDVKRAARLATFGVVVLCLSILILTASFIARTLNAVAVAKTSDSNKTLKIEGVNTTLLEKTEKFVTDKGAADRQLGPNVRNPFTSPPAPPAPPPAPAPAPPTTPPPTPPPAP